jgi:TonB family protein
VQQNFPEVSLMPAPQGPKPECAPRPPADEITPRAPRFSFPRTPRLHELLENLSAAILPVNPLPREIASRWLPGDTRLFNSVQSLRARELSLVTHLLVITLIFFPLLNQVAKKTISVTPDGDFIPLREWDEARKELARLAQGGGSGGNHNPIPPRKGGLAFFWPEQFAPPKIVDHSKAVLEMPATLVGPPDIKIDPQKQWGLLDGKNTNSQGPGWGDGFGDKGKGGQGKGRGAGGGDGEDSGVGDSGKYARGALRSYPECQFCPDPKFTEEARKAKLQGNVTLEITVLPNGRAANIRVLRGLGMGLDERAMETVATWVFRPARALGGQTVPYRLLVEVSYRLM